MSDLSDFRFLQLRSLDDEATFFALMGRFFASASVRRECGGYPLNDGPRYRWFVAQRICDARVLGFVSVEEQPGIIRIRDGYIRPEVRGCGLFRELRRRVLAYVEHMQVSVVACVPLASVPRFEAHGFRIRGARGRWVTMERGVDETTC